MEDRLRTLRAACVPTFLVALVLCLVAWFKAHRSLPLFIAVAYLSLFAFVATEACGPIAARSGAFRRGLAKAVFAPMAIITAVACFYLLAALFE